MVRLCGIGPLGRNRGRDDGSRDGRNALATPGQPEPVGRGARDRDRRAANRCGEHFLRLGAPRGNFWPVADDLYGDVTHAVPRIGHEFRHGRQQVGARRPGPPGIVRPKADAEVAKPGSRQQRIARRMRGDIAIRMSGQAIQAWPQEPSKIERPTGTQRVDVNSDAHPWQVSAQ